jgi:hypothetical protein
MVLIFSAIEALCLAVLTRGDGTETYPFLAVWTVLVGGMAAAQRMGAFPSLTSAQRAIHTVSALSFPPFIAARFWAREHGVIEHHGPPNRIQHVIWSGAMTALFVPAMARCWGNVSRFERVVMSVALVVLCGVLVEIVEFRQFSSQYTSDPSQGLWAWRDTNIDEMMNVLGATIVAVLATRPAGFVGLPSRTVDRADGNAPRRARGDRRS